MSLELILSVMIVLISLIVSLILTKYWIKIAKNNDLVGKDMNKYEKKPVAEAGGIAVVVSVVIGILLYIFIKTFVLGTESNIIEALTIITSCLLAGFIGFIDDILGWKKGLKSWQKILMTLIIAVPLMVINVGHSVINLPFIGLIDFGIFYPLIIIPLGVVGATNGINILAGYNGLETGLGIIIFTFLGIILWHSGLLWLVLIAGIIILSLFGFLMFNKYPARIFPGDSLTYLIGALVACFAIIGNMQKFAIILFIPFIIEGVLKARSKFKAENFGKVSKDNSLEAPYEKIYSLTHFTLKLLKKIKPNKKVYEKDVVYFLWGLEIVIGLLVLLII